MNHRDEHFGEVLVYFDPVEIEPLPVLRTEGGQPVAGFLVVARKPLAA